MHQVSAGAVAATEADLHNLTEQARPTILHSVPSVSRISTGSALERTVVLGGQRTASLPSFTVSTRLRGRHVLVDTDLTPDEIGKCSIRPRESSALPATANPMPGWLARRSG